MKKWLSILLCLCMVLGLMACGSSAGDTGNTSAKEANANMEGTFRVGYSKVNITPKYPVPLWGYSVRERLHDEVLDYIYITCVAITDEKDNTVLMYTVDVGDMGSTVAGLIKTSANNVCGVPRGNVFVSATHTHSAPYSSNFGPALTDGAAQAAEEAMADRKPAEMYFGKANTSGINFIRSYYLPDGSVAGVNYGNMNAPEYAGHTSEIDEEMRILQFKREGGKDVILANWQCHPHMTGGSEKYMLSADIVGMMRNNMEQDLDCLFAYYQGGAGNIDPTSFIRSEEANSDRDYREHGRLMAVAAKTALQNMTKVATGDIKILTQTQTYNSNKTEREKAIDAAMVIAYYEAGHTTSETKAYAESLNVGIYSYYHAKNIQERGGLPETYDITFSAISIGDFAWSIFPGEFFDDTFRQLRADSPYAYNFTSGYTNDYIGYFPTDKAWDIGGYEVGATRVERGVAEDIQAHMLEMLNALHS